MQTHDVDETGPCLVRGGIVPTYTFHGILFGDKHIVGRGL